MEKNYMLTKEDSLKERFNAHNFTVERGNQNQFVFYYLQILEFAYQIKLIDETVRDALANNLLLTIQERAGRNTALATNYMYVVTLWLHTMNNWEAWLQLSSLKNKKAAEILLNSATSWFSLELESISSLLKETKQNVFTLKEQSIIGAYQYLDKTISKTEMLNVNLKGFHTSPIDIAYTFLFETQNSNYLDALRDCVKKFSTEVSILTKMDAKSVMKRKHTEVEKLKNTTERKTLNLHQSFNEQLASLKAEKNRRMQLYQKEQKELSLALSKLEEKFAADHPNLTGNDLEDEFDDYLDTLPEDFFSSSYSDENEIESWFEAEKSKLIKSFELQEKHLEKKQAPQADIIDSTDYSLESLIKEFALFSLAQKQVIAYPSTLEERSIALANLPTSDAVFEFMKESGIQFSDSEMNYLKTAIKNNM